jgi:hypothetical protein
MYPQIMKLYVDITTSNPEEHELLLVFLDKIRAKVIREDTPLSSPVPNSYGYLQVFCNFQQWIDIKTSELYSRASFQIKK